jgi:Na+/H+ antiporter NhaD/arsenite permease-like protein
MGFSQILAISIFLIMFIAIIWGKVHRYIPALIGALIVILVLFLSVMHDPQAVLSVLNIGAITHYEFWIPGQHHIESAGGINWQTIIFIAGMMIMVEGMGEAGFFRWLCLVVAKIVHYKIVPILIAFMLLSTALAMFIDSITVMLFMASVTIELSRMLKFDPVPIIIAEIFASNVGGAATMSGDPPNIIIGTALGFSFTDFLFNTGIIAWISIIVAMLFFYFSFRTQLKNNTQQNLESLNYPNPGDAIPNMKYFLISTIIFFIVVILLVTHAATGLSVALIGVIAAILTLITSGRKGISLIKKLDWKTLLFFVGLFVVVGGLEKTGVLEMIAAFISAISGGNIVLVITIILWLSAIASALVDNIPFAATMVPVIKNLALSQGISLEALSWTLALGTDIGGNATPIGASANVVGTAIAEREGHPISWGKYMKYAIPATIIVLGLCMVYLIWRYT